MFTQKCNVINHDKILFIHGLFNDAAIVHIIQGRMLVQLVNNNWKGYGRKREPSCLTAWYFLEGLRKTT
jgi:hypothetical protein